MEDGRGGGGVGESGERGIGVPNIVTRIVIKSFSVSQKTILPWKDPTHVFEVMLCHASPVSLKFKSSASLNTTSESFKQKVQCDCNNSFLCQNTRR